MVIYDEERLRHEQRLFAARETYALHHRALAGVAVAAPLIAALVLVLLRDALTWLVAGLIFLGVVGIAVAGYAAGRAVLRALVERRFGIVETRGR